jgi:hypothetical protein
LSVRCRVCHDELLKACAEIAELKTEVAKLKEFLRLARAKSRRDRRRHKAANTERDEARAKLERTEWELRVLEGSE